jgi:DNA-binding NarL/FixJ family response regulator
MLTADEARRLRLCFAAKDAVKGHMKNILAKLQANDRTHAVMIAMKRGFLDD